jgi:hypothetical protein
MWLYRSPQCVSFPQPKDKTNTLDQTAELRTASLQRSMVAESLNTLYDSLLDFGALESGGTRGLGVFEELLMTLH